MDLFSGVAIPKAWELVVENELRQDAINAFGVNDEREFRLLISVLVGVSNEDDQVTVPFQVVAQSFGVPNTTINHNNATRFLGESTDSILKRLFYHGNLDGDVLLEPHRYQSSKSRIIHHFGSLLPALRDRLQGSLTQTVSEMKDPVLLDFHRRIQTPSAKSKTVAERRDEVARYMPLVPLQGELLSYLNGINTRTFSIPSNRFSAARDWVVANQEGSKQQSSLSQLRFLQTCSVSFYRPSKKGLSVRVHPAFVSLASVKKELRPILQPNWIELDLVSAHLSFIAMDWDVPILRDMLKSGTSIWNSLWQRSKEFGVDATFEDCKPGYKAAIYAIAYGGGRRKARVELDIRSNVDMYNMEAFEKSFKTSPLVRELFKVRAKKIKEIRTKGGIQDGFDRWIEVGTHKSARTALAIVAQSKELITLSPVLKEAIRVQKRQQRPDFTITLWQHDGFSIQVADRNKSRSIVRRLQKLVSNELPEWGPKVLEVQYAPDWFTDK